VFGSGAQKPVDWGPFSAWFLEFRGRDLVVDQLNASVGRNNVDMVGLQFFRLVDLYDRHACAPADNLRQPAAVIRIKMHHHHEGSACMLGKRLEEPLQGGHAACRRSDRHDDRFCRVSLRLLIDLAVIARHGTPPFTPSSAEGFRSWPEQRSFNSHCESTVHLCLTTVATRSPQAGKFDFVSVLKLLRSICENLRICIATRRFVSHRPMNCSETGSAMIAALRRWTSPWDWPPFP
jgi:hypothetical protein